MYSFPFPSLQQWQFTFQTRLNLQKSAKLLKRLRLELAREQAFAGEGCRAEEARRHIGNVRDIGFRLHSRGEGASQRARLRTYVFMSSELIGSRLMPSPAARRQTLGAPYPYPSCSPRSDESLPRYPSTKRVALFSFALSKRRPGECATGFRLLPIAMTRACSSPSGSSDRASWG